MNIGAPQAIKVVLMVFYLFLIAHLHGKPKLGTYNFWTSLIGVAINIGLLYWGGFFG